MSILRSKEMKRYFIYLLYIFYVPIPVLFVGDTKVNEINCIFVLLKFKFYCEEEDIISNEIK